MTARKPTAADVRLLDNDADAAAVMLSIHAPATFGAVVALYCEYLDDEPAPPGRHVETAEITGGAL